MYLFITYAREGMRGVQVRGLRIAKYFSKKEVIFINGGNSDWIRKEGYKYRNYDYYDFNKFYFPSQIKLPRDIECIVFCDLPTNRAFPLSILMFAKEKKIPCVVLDNIYRRNQVKDTVYKNIKFYSDKLILNGLNFLSENNDKDAVVVPPLIDDTLITGKKKEEIRNEVLKKLKIRKKPSKIVFGIGYNLSIYKAIIEISNYFREKNTEILFIIISQTKKVKKKPNFIEIPSVSGDKMSFFIKASDLVICKAGYLQVIETLAMGIPLVAIYKTKKETSGFNKKWLDKKILNSIITFDIISKSAPYNLYKKIRKLFDSPVIYQRMVKKIKSLHNNKLNGAEITSNLIKKTKFLPKKFPKIIIISLDKKEEMEETKKILREYPFALPIYFSMPFFTKVFNRKLSDYNPTTKNEILRYNPSLIYSLGLDSLHSLAKILPWYNLWLKNIESFVKNSDKCIIIGKETYNCLEKIIVKYKKKIIVIDVRGKKRT